MCKYKTLHHNEYGYIIKCEQCNHIQIAFGTVALIQEEEEFHSFRKYISRFYDEKKEEYSNVSPFEKSIYLRTPMKNIQFVLTINELKNLNELLDQSGLMLEVEKIFYVNEN